MINDIHFMGLTQWRLLDNSIIVFWSTFCDNRCIFFRVISIVYFIERGFQPLVIYLKDIEKLFSHSPRCDSMRVPQSLIYILMHRGWFIWKLILAIWLYLVPISCCLISSIGLYSYLKDLSLIRPHSPGLMIVTYLCCLILLICETLWGGEIAIYLVVVCYQLKWY